MPREFTKEASEILNRIDNYCQSYDDGHRTHLGASLIGDKCKRKLWFTFRWVYHHVHTGRMQRLFNTGHKEELRIIEWLNGTGYQVKNEDTNGKQFRITHCNEHFGGSIDGVVLVNEESYLLECKTNKTGSEFKSLFDMGMALAKPKHWAQTCTYGFKLGIKKVLYICKNKDNDDLYIEIANLDWKHGEENLLKAEEIIRSQLPPARLAETPAYFECKYCDFVDICHRGKVAENNCRSCKFARPVENAQWECEKYGTIPKDEIGKSKPCWESII